MRIRTAIAVAAAVAVSRPARPYEHHGWLVAVNPLWRASTRHGSPTEPWVYDRGYALLLSALFWGLIAINLPRSLGHVDDWVAAANFGAANPFDRAVKLTCMAVSLWLIARRPMLVVDLLKVTNPFLVALLILAPLSVLWSIYPSATMLRSVSLAGTLLLCFAIGLASWQPRRLQQIVGPPLALIIGASLVVGIFAPDLVIEQGDSISLRDAWHGVLDHKNEFGIVSSFGVLLCVHGLACDRRRSWVLAAGVAASFICLLLSKSNGSLFATVLSVLMMLSILCAGPRLRPHLPLLVGVAAGVILIYEIAALRLLPGLEGLLRPIVDLTGKDLTFSARTVIWDVIEQHIRLSPVIGSGYGAYWVGPIPQSPSYVFLSVMFLYPTSSHNGYLEVVNDLGMIGFGCLLGFVTYYIMQALQLVRVDRAQAALYLGLLFQQMVINLSESEWFSRSTSFAVLALASTCLSRAVLEFRLRANAGS